MKSDGPSEFQIQKAFVGYLRLKNHPGLCWFHVPNQATGGPARGAHLKALGRRPGAPDIILIYKGRVIGLELKAGFGRPSKAQIEFAKAMLEAGSEYVISTGLPEAIDVVENIIS